jgi:hypothetical protein
VKQTCVTRFISVRLLCERCVRRPLVVGGRQIINSLWLHDY